MIIKNKRRDENGFSYLDVMVGMVIMLIGCTALVSAVTASVLRARDNQQQLMAKQIASSTLESIFSARDISRTAGVDSWLTVGNVGTNPDPNTSVPQGIFLTGLRPIREDAGPDNVVGTNDDACAAPGTCTGNTSVVIDGFWRQVTITDINDPERPSPPFGTWPVMMRRIDIVIKYVGAGAIREEKVSTIISKY